MTEFKQLQSFNGSQFGVQKMFSAFTNFQNKIEFMLHLRGANRTA